MRLQLFINHITDFSLRLKIPSFKDLHIDQDQFETIADMSFSNNSNPSNPRALDKKDYLKILENAFR
jgi:alcohol dehydrogenase class IV